MTNVSIMSNIYSVIPKPGFVSLTIVYHTIARAVFFGSTFSRQKQQAKTYIREITVLFRDTRIG